MDPKLKEWIDNASDSALLYRWRFASLGDIIFQGEIGKYYIETLAKRRKALEDATDSRHSLGTKWSDLSKEVGWDER